MILNVNKTTIRLSNPEAIALYLIAKEKGLTPQELASDLVKHATKPKASFIRDYLTIKLIRRIL